MIELFSIHLFHTALGEGQDFVDFVLHLISFQELFSICHIDIGSDFLERVNSCSQIFSKIHSWKITSQCSPQQGQMPQSICSVFIGSLQHSLTIRASVNRCSWLSTLISFPFKNCFLLVISTLEQIFLSMSTGVQMFFWIFSEQQISCQNFFGTPFAAGSIPP